MAKHDSFSQQAAGYAYTELHGKFSKRVTDSVCRVLDSKCGRAGRDAIFWNLSMTSLIGEGDISDNPTLFVEGLTAIYGSATKPLEDAMVAELRTEFGLGPPVQDEGREGRVGSERFAGVLARAGNAGPTIARDPIV
jgi:hypothetical protein